MSIWQDWRAFRDLALTLIVGVLVGVGLGLRRGRQAR
jgi:hypothetical protein